MNWISIGLAALSGALAAGIARALVRDPKKNRVAYAVAVGIVFAALQGISRQTILPELNVWKAESELLKVPAYQAIKTYDPETYDRILSELKSALRKSVPESEIIGQLRGHITGLIQKRLPYASDQAVVSYMSVVVTEMNELNAHGGDLCYRFLFPPQSGPVAGQTYFSKSTQEADSAALTEVIRTSSENRQNIPLEGDVEPRLAPVYLELSKEYGNDISMLENPAAPNIDKAKVCSMMASLYARILRLPQNESGKILRFMMSQQ